MLRGRIIKGGGEEEEGRERREEEDSVCRSRFLFVSFLLSTFWVVVVS